MTTDFDISDLESRADSDNVSPDIASDEESIFSREDPRVIPFSDSDINLLNAVENEMYGLGGGDYWRR